MTGRGVPAAPARVSRAAPHWPARIVAGVSIAAGTVAALVSFVEGSRNGLLGVMFVGVVAAYAIVAVLIIERRPGNRVGPIILGMAVLMAGYLVADAYIRQPSPPPGGAIVAAAVMAMDGPFFALISALFLLFPEGHLPSPRWRIVLQLDVLFAIVTAAGVTLTPGPISYYPEIENPFGIAGFPGVVLWAPFYLGLIVLVVLSALSLIGRWRRGGPTERAQLKWVVSAAGVLALAMGGYGVLFGPGAYNDVADLAVSAGLALFPIGIGIAILRYRLYEIDRLVSRTLTYAALTAVLAVVYLAGFLGLQAALAPFTKGGGPIAVAASTLAVFALFQPLRGRLKSAMDRRFNRSRYDGQQIVEAFAERLRDEVDLRRLDGELRTVVERTVAPVHTRVWLRGAGR